MKERSPVFENLFQSCWDRLILSVSGLFQFIVVSLKDGMFNNANVLYKTRFVDGVSTIARHSQTQNKKTNMHAKNMQKIKH